MVLISETIQNGLIKVYDASPNAENIQLQDSVLAAGFPNNIVTVGTGFSPLIRGAANGYIQDQSWPTVLNVGERYVQVYTVRMPGWVNTFVVPGLELNSAGFAEYMEPQGITNAFWLPPGTYIV